jgi:hypothetical protein
VFVLGFFGWTIIQEQPPRHIMIPVHFVRWRPTVFLVITVISRGAPCPIDVVPSYVRTFRNTATHSSHRSIVFTRNDERIHTPHSWLVAGDVRYSSLLFLLTGSFSPPNQETTLLLLFWHPLVAVFDCRIGME